ncbi:MAG: LL-diaminopimelate aminotransferase [Spirochaetales bacterium]|nr:LL-diaminopimelate aminotransferase [Spirochaetales bacterium]
MELLLAQRLGGKDFGNKAEIYKFERIKQAKAQAVKNNPHIRLIDMGIGEPDTPAPGEIIDILAQEAGKPGNRYYADNGIPEFREAAARYMAGVYRITDMDPGKQIIHGIGSKPILAMLPLCFINPGDITLTTVPGYPVTATYTRYLGGRVFPLPLWEQNNFFPDFSSIPRSIIRKARLLYINYPNNPTAQVATKEFFREVVDFAWKNNIAVIHDAAYAALTYDGYSPLSFFSVDGAKDIGVEVHSLSKAFNMTGWRLAFVCGNKKIIKAYGTVKDNTDSGQFRAIQKAGIHALNNPHLTNRVCEKYSRRFNLLVDALRHIGFKAEKPKGSFYLYVPCPQGTSETKTFKKFHNAVEFSEFLLEKALISTVPEDDAGHFIRFSVTFEANGEDEEKAVINEVKERMLKLKLVF